VNYARFLQCSVFHSISSSWSSCHRRNRLLALYTVTSEYRLQCSAWLCRISWPLLILVLYRHLWCAILLLASRHSPRNTLFFCVAISWSVRVAGQLQPWWTAEEKWRKIASIEYISRSICCLCHCSWWCICWQTVPTYASSVRYFTAGIGEFGESEFISTYLLIQFHCCLSLIIWFSFFYCLC